MLKKLTPVERSSRHKQSRVMAELHDLARKLGRGAKLPTVRELSKQLDINSLTLNKCLEKLEARGILCCRQGSGIYVDSGVDQRRIALVFGSDIFSQRAIGFGALMLRHSAERASLHNERFTFYIDESTTQGTLDGREIPVHQDLADAFREGKIDGVILLYRNSVEQENWLRDRGVPVVCPGFFQGTFSTNTDVVYFDFQSLIQKGVDALCSAGCRTVGLIATSPEMGNLFRAALRQRGIFIQEQWILDRSIGICHDPCRMHAAFGAVAARQFLSKSGWRVADDTSCSLCDGLLITDDVMASGILPVLATQGIRIGQDLVVCSHDNKGSDVLAGWDIKRVQFDIKKVAVAIFETLETLFSGASPCSPCLIKPVVVDAESRPSCSIQQVPGLTDLRKQATKTVNL